MSHPAATGRVMRSIMNISFYSLTGILVMAWRVTLGQISLFNSTSLHASSFEKLVLGSSSFSNQVDGHGLKESEHYFEKN